MMPIDQQSLEPHAAALQCVAEDFRRVAAARGATDQDLERFASVLDHIAASLIVGGGGASAAQLQMVPA